MGEGLSDSCCSSFLPIEGFAFSIGFGGEHLGWGMVFKSSLIALFYCFRCTLGVRGGGEE